MIGASVVIRGEISSQEDLRIDGRVRGEILARAAALVIGQAADVEADIRGLRITILGRVVGNVSASERIELGATAEVRGTLSANLVVVADGARFNGRVDMGQRSIVAAVAHHRSTTGGGA